MKITDAVLLGDVRVTGDGYLEANARTARTGIQFYRGSELGRDDLDVVSVYRDETEVFRKDSLETFSKIPVTLDHPPVAVDAENWREYAVGVTGDEVLRDGEYLKIGLKITDAAAVKAVQDGHRQLSVGYTTDLTWEDGVAPDGTRYQAKQTNIIANHIAAVRSGRAGPEVRIGDAAANWGVHALDAQTSHTKERHPMPDEKKVVWDGLSITSDENGAQIIEKMKKRIEDADKAVTDAEAAHTKAIAAKDAAIAEKDRALAAKDAEIDSLKGRILDAAALDAKVAARSDLLDKARKIAPKGEFAGLTDAEIRRTAVTATLGDAALADKTEAYVDAYFDILVDKATKADPVRDAFKTTMANDAKPDAAWSKMVERNQNAWKKGA